MERFHGLGGNKQFLNQKGQIAIESLLLATILVAFFLALKNQLQSRQVFQKLTTTSAQKVKHMAEYGTWKDLCKPVSGSGSEREANCHPNSINRSLSSAPD
jgi:hypothetical protein